MRYIIKTFGLLLFAITMAAGFGIDPLGINGNGSIQLAAIVSGATLTSLQKNFNAIFNQAMEAMPPSWPKYAMKVTSNGASEDYQWLGDTPAMREWLGDKFVKDLTGFNYSVPNKDWEATVGVRRNDIEDDQLGKYTPIIQQLSEEGVVQQDVLLTELRVAGTANDCYDGKKYYAANHAVGKSGTQSNLIAGAGVSLSNITADFQKVRAAFRKFRTDQNKPFIRQRGKLKILCTIPADLESVFEQLKNSTLISNSDNTLKDAFEYEVDSNLTDQADWYADYVGSAIRPFVMQMRKEPNFVSMTNPETEEVFKRAKFLYSVEARFNAAYGLWPYSIKVNN